MTTLPLFVVALLTVQNPPLVPANAGRPAICVAPSADTEPADQTRDLPDSARDLERALRSLERKHQFAVAAAGGSCAIKLLVQRRIEDEEEETYTVIVRLTTSPPGGQPHVEELTATQSSWRGAASTIASTVASFVDTNRSALASTSSTGAPPVSAASTTSTMAASASTRASSPAPPPPSPPPLPGSSTSKPATPSRTSASARTIEDGILDWVRLSDAGGRTAQTPVYMRLFTSDKANLGTGGEGGKETRASEAKTVQGQGPSLLRETFLARAATAGLKAAAHGDDASVPADGLVIEGEFVTIDPGSRAKRYLVGFGAGKSAIEIAGRVRDASGTIVAEFRHRRIGAMGIGGGDSLGKLLSDTRSCGEDLAKFMEAWLANKPLK